MLHFKVECFVGLDEKVRIDYANFEDTVTEIVSFLDKEYPNNGYVRVTVLSSHAYNPNCVPKAQHFNVKDAQSFMDWVTTMYRCHF